MDSYEKFIIDLGRALNVDLSGYKRPQMERRINTLMRSLNIKNYDDFIRTMQKDKEIYERFMKHITINVSEFFRNNSQWKVLETKILPELLKKSPILRIWSAGCSTGEECYSLAMLLSERFPQGRHSIWATDFDRNVLMNSKEGYYLKKNIVGIPEVYLKKYFDIFEEGYKAKDSLKKMIKFDHHNLLRDKFPQNYDLILCRNVVIYFTEKTKFELYKRFFSALRSQGVLFTGSTEQIIQAKEIGYESAALFFYRRP